MLLAFFRRRRRERILEKLFPKHWEDEIKEKVSVYRQLSDDEQDELKNLVQIFVHEKRWEGCGGFILSDSVKSVIAAQACILVLKLGIDAYSNVREILVYPSAVVPPRSGPLFGKAIPESPAHPHPFVGEAMLRGPVVLSWDAVLAGGLDAEDGQNVVYHEFAHKLDMASGSSNGLPQLADENMRRRWLAVLDREYERINKKLDHGESTFLDSYAASSKAEFFAVATEYFFEQPEGLDRKHATLYRLLAKFYRQDPVVRRRKQIRSLSVLEEASLRPTSDQLAKIDAEFELAQINGGPFARLFQWVMPAGTDLVYYRILRILFWVALVGWFSHRNIQLHPIAPNHSVIRNGALILPKNYP